jgi:autotransporter-associated beta strand protein
MRLGLDYELHFYETGKMRSHNFAKVIVLQTGIVITLAVAAAQVHAADVTWTGANNTSWNNSLNWLTVPPGGIPASGDSLIFNSAAPANQPSNNNISGLTASGIDFIAGAGAHTLGGNGVNLGWKTTGLITHAGDIVNGSSAVQTINHGVTLDAAKHLISTGTGALNLHGPITQSKGSVAVFTNGGGGISLAGSGLSNTNGILGGWATIGIDWAALDGSNNVVPYSAYTDVAGGGTIADGASTNVRIPASGAAIGITTPITNINTLMFGSNAATAAAQTVNVGAGNTIVLGQNGGIYNTTQAVGTVRNLTIGASVAAGGTLTAGNGSNPATITLSGNPIASTSGIITINSVIADNTASGPVSVVVRGGYVGLNGANTHSGGTYILSGRVSQPNSSTFGTGPVYIFPGGMANPGTNQANDFFIAGFGTPEGDGFGAIRMFGSADISGTITLVEDAAINPTNGTTDSVSGKITGPGGLQVGSGNGSQNGGTLLIGKDTGVANKNDYAGDTRIRGHRGGTGSGVVAVLRIRPNAVPSDNNNIMPHGLTGSFNAGPTGNLILDADVPPSGEVRSAVFDLNGTTQTINGLSSTSTAPSNNFVQSMSVDGHLILGDSNADGDFGGIIRDNGGTLAITKIGSGTQTFSGTDLSYSGATIVNGGRLNINSSLPNSSSVTVNNGSALGTQGGTIGQSVNFTSGGSLSVGGALTIGGTLTIGTAAADTTVMDIVPNPTPNNLVGAINLTGTDTLVVNSGANTITTNIDKSLIPEVTTYRLVDYNGSIQGTGAGAGAFTTVPGILPNRTTATVVHNAGATAIDLVVTATDRPRWTGALSTEWSTDVLPGAGNWVLNSNGTTKTDFLTDDHPLFDDTATGTTVDISDADVLPASVTFNNSSKTYTLTGSKGITGSTKLIKNGTGNVIITNSNSYTGATQINAGSVQIGNGGATGDLGSSPIVNAGVLIINRSDSHTVSNVISGAGEVRHVGAGVTTFSGLSTYSGVTNIQAGTVKTVNNFSLGDPAAAGAVNVSAGATLDVGGSNSANNTDFGAKQFNIVGAGVGGQGAIINSNTAIAQQNAFESIVLTGNATIGAYGRFDVRGGAATLDLGAGGFTLTKKGTNHFGVVAGTITDGNIIVEEGNLTLEGATTVSDFDTGKKITFQDGTQLQFFGTSGSITRPMEFNGTVNVHNNDDAASTFDSPVTMKGSATYTWINDASPVSPTTQNGVISESGGPRGIEAKTVNTANSLVLKADNTYTGSTSVSGPGTLSLSPFTGISNLANTSTVSVASNSFLNLDYSGTDTIGALLLSGVSVAPGVYSPEGLGIIGAIETPRLTGFGTLTVTAQILPGDFNDDDKVDAADYVMWRNNEGTFAILANDPYFGTEIDADQYNIWRANFGNTIPGSGGGAGLPGAVPEPGAILLALMTVFAGGFVRGSRGVKRPR